MRDYLLRFDDEAAAIAALPDLHDGDGWVGGPLPVALVTVEAVFGEDGDGMPVVETARQVEPGFWLLALAEGLPGEVATIERETGCIVAGDTGLAGARLDPAWAGAEPVLTVTDEQATLEAARAGRLDEARDAIAARLAEGAPIGELHVALDDGSRADLTAMGTTALAALSDALAWPESYAQGWISVENIRIPLPAPTDGLVLADAVGTHYGTLVQRGRDLKDAIAAAADLAALQSIDIDAALAG